MLPAPTVDLGNFGRQSNLECASNFQLVVNPDPLPPDKPLMFEESHLPPPEQDDDGPGKCRGLIRREREWWIRERCCIYCGQRGHFRDACPKWHSSSGNRGFLRSCQVSPTVTVSHTMLQATS
ncbi:hypothetical protein SKAU_G00212640 [Synaphobranchus kaupii]|uniref:CCHC-type domain-containing protein n=1 Tax=Synaphobranchus kaupii TaxID=118154 RepID=A0A9Q1F9D8_SYNKA|nr:hypothetical protein SKAU_G00212640 [Synaphobranchus kaupii]